MPSGSAALVEVVWGLAAENGLAAHEIRALCSGVGTGRAEDATMWCAAHPATEDGVAYTFLIVVQLEFIEDRQALFQVADCLGIVADGLVGA